MLRRLSLSGLLIVLVGALAPTASPSPKLMVGVADHTILTDPAWAGSVARDLGLRAIRVPVIWQAGQTELTEGAANELDRAIAEAGGRIKLVPIVYSEDGRDAPQTPAERTVYCEFVADLVTRYPAIHDVVIWIEPNTQYFWNPQYHPDGSSAAPAAFAALLAACYDIVKSARPDINVVYGPLTSNGNDRPHARHRAHAPGTFIRRMGDAYRASGRAGRLFDTVGHNPYPAHSSERPWARHPRGTAIGQGDWDKLMQALHDGFAGTSQPIPGDKGPGGRVPIWYLETGFQTHIPAAKQHLYTGVENAALPVLATAVGRKSPAGTSAGSRAKQQGTQLIDSISLAYCQPYVEAYFNFKLSDEHDLRKFQAGVHWHDRTRKPSYTAFKRVTRQVNRRTIKCAEVRKRAPGAMIVNTFEPKSAISVERIGWPRKRAFNWKHDQWRFRLKVEEDATYTAAVTATRRKKKRGRTGSAVAARRPVLQTTGSLRGGYYQWVKFPRRKLARGTYRISITVTATLNGERAATVKSKKFRVKPKKRRARRG